MVPKIAHMGKWEASAMARPIWKGSISFGLVNIPVTLYSGERKVDLQFRLVDSRNNARVRYERVNEQTGEEVPWDAIVKAYEYEDGRYVMLTDEDFEKVKLEVTKTVAIEDFVDETEIESVYYDKPYYLEPGKQGDKGYALLRETLRRTGKVGIAKVVIRTRQYLAAILVRDNVLVMNVMRFPQEIVPHTNFNVPEEDLSKLKISDKEINMAEQLVEAMSDEWEPEKYKDEYRETLLEWIMEKAEKGKVESVADEKEAEPAPASVVDIFGLLKESVEKKGATHKESTKKAPARQKPAASKAGDRKKPAKKTPAKKTTPTRRRAAG